MKTRRWAGIACLFLATVAVLGLARARSAPELIWTDGSPAVPKEETPLEAQAARQALQDYFYRHYSEAACSAIYVDLTHDGQPELLVLEMEKDRTGEAVPLHSGPLDPDLFSGATATVLRAESSGAVLPIYSFACGAAHAQWGQLYLRQWEGRPHLLWYAPYTANRRSDFRLALFSLGENGVVRDVVRESVAFAAAPDAAQAGDDGEEEIAAFEQTAASLLEGAKPVIVYDIIHNRTTGADTPRQFDYLDELFTDF